MPGSLVSNEYSIDDAIRRADIAQKYGFILNDFTAEVREFLSKMNSDNENNQ